MADRTPRATLFRAISPSRLAILWDMLPDPDSVLKKKGLRREALRVILESDEEIYGLIETRRDAVFMTPWTLQTQDERVTDQATWLAEVLRPHVQTLMQLAFNAVLYGYSVFEIVYERLPERRIGIGRVLDVNLNQATPLPSGRLKLSFEDGRPEQTVEPGLKFFLTQKGATYQNPFGEALLARLYWPWFFRYNAMRFWMEHVERFGSPLVVGQVASPNDFVSAMQEMGFDAVIGVGIQEAVKAVFANGQGEHERLMRYLSRRCQILVLGQTLTADVDGKGSYAAAKVHDQVRQDKRRSDLRLVAGTIQQVVNALWRLNGFGMAPPQFRFDLEEPVMTEEEARVYAELKRAGVQLTQDFYLRRHRFREGDLIIEGSTGQQSLKASRSEAKPSERSFGASPPLTLSAGRRWTDAQEEVERIADQLLLDAPPPIPPEKIREAILKAKDPRDLERRLAELFAEVDLKPDGFAKSKPSGFAKSKTFSQILEDALFAADVLGYAAATKGES